MSSLAQQVLGKERRALSKAITLVESSQPQDQQRAHRLLEEIMPHAGNSIRIGVSGSPGVGKSTFLEAFGLHLIKAGHQVAALTIDPSSNRSGGSILGDKTRMSALANEPRAFIRPTPSGGQLGGVARRSREVIALCEAAGYDIIFVETVGVGQSEIDVANMTDCYCLLLQPASGDVLQGIKRGVMELADVIVVNKADGALLSLAREAASQVMIAVSLMGDKVKNWKCPAVLASALKSEGLDDVDSAIHKFIQLAKTTGRFEKNRQQQLVIWLEDEVLYELSAQFKSDLNIQNRHQKMCQKLDSNSVPMQLAQQFVKKYLKRVNHDWTT